MRKLSNRRFVLPVLMAFLLMCVSAYGKPSNTKTKQGKVRASKSLEVRTPVKRIGTGNVEVDQAQSFLDKGISRLSESLECNC